MSGTLTRHRALVALLGALAFASIAHAQWRASDPVPQTDDIRQTVARVAYFSGEVSYNRGDDPDDWQPALLNFPMTLGDRLYAARNSRVELQTEGGTIYLAPETDFTALNLTDDVKQFSLGIGTASFRIRRIDPGESFEVDTPNSAVTFDGPGEYRIDVDGDGNTRVIVNRGYAYVAAAGGEVPLEAGHLMAIDGIDAPVYDVMSLPRGDSWDQWVVSRSRRFIDTGARRFVNPNISGIEDLNEYGGWSEVPGYGMCWSPANVSADWQPYRAGRWAWQDPWGWSWVSNEPWGWAPYHYGRWVTSRSRWYWVPIGPDVRTVRYAPALVVFVGGPGFSLSVSVGGGGRGDEGRYVGWFPLAPRETFVPWWGSGARAGTVTNVPNVTYVNRTYVTVVNQNTFVSGAPVGSNVVRDARTVRDISAAPVVQGSIQVVPLPSSIRPATQNAVTAPRPPTATLNRAVVTRLAPPPAPPLFRDKANLIRENRGAPVASAEAARLPLENRARRPTRPVAVEGGRVALAPKNAQVAGPAPVPVTRALPPGQTRRQQKPEQPQDAAAARQQPQADSARRQQDVAAAAQQQQAEAARRQQQDVAAATQQQQAEAARKQQQDAAAARQQQADAARKQQQDAAAATQQQQAEAARKRQQDAAAAAQQQQAEAARKQQQDVAAATQQQQAEAARKQQQDAAAARQQQQAEAARKQQQDVAAATQQQQAEAARKQQQDAAAARQQQQPDNTRKQQGTKPVDNTQAAKPETKGKPDKATARTNVETVVGTVTAYQAGKKIEILTSENTRRTIDLGGKNMQVSVVGPVAVGAHVQLVQEKGDQNTRVSVTVKK
jgi:hypothetical protein